MKLKSSSAMCTNSKSGQTLLEKGKKAVGLSFFLLVFLFQSFAQRSPVSVNIMVTPPYTSSISDYMTIPNKIVVTLMHTAPDYPDLELYLHVSIMGDNGISAISDKSYRPPMPITLARGSSYKVSMDNINEAFNLRYINIEGTTLANLVHGAGLPEGNYQFCIQAFDFNTREPLSPDAPIGCSNLFNITNLEPPMIITPICGEPQLSAGSQAVLASWLQPPGAPLGTSYLFEMVEIAPNVNINPNEAFQIAKFPVLFEETLSQTSLFLTANKVSMNQGHIYAFRVTAHDPGGKVNFRNNGTSEICWFKYENQTLAHNVGDKWLRYVLPAYNHPDSLLFASSSGDFHTAWRVEPFDTLVYQDPLLSFPECRFLVEFFEKPGSKAILSTTTTNAYLQANGNSFEDGKTYWTKVSIITQNNDILLSSDLTAFKYVLKQKTGNTVTRTLSGKYEYKFEKDDPGSYPLAKASVKVHARFVLNDTINNRQIIVPEEAVPSNLKNNISNNLTGAPLASGSTNIAGHFSLSLQWPEDLKIGEISSSFTYFDKGKSYTGKLSLCLYTEIENPYYKSETHAINYDQISYNLGNLYAYVYSYKLVANITEGYKDAPGLKKSLANKEVYILRKNKPDGLPPYEGERVNSTSMLFIPPELQNSGYQIVSSGITKEGKDQKGNDVATVTFTRLIQNRLPNDEYYLWIKGTSKNTAQPFRYSISSGQITHEIDIPGQKTYLDLGECSFFVNTPQSISIPKSNEPKTFSMENATYTNLTGGGKQYTVHSDQLNFQQTGGDIENLGFTPSNAPQTGYINLEEFDFSKDKISLSQGTYSDFGAYSFTVESEFSLISNQPPMSGISGRIVYEFPGKPGNARPLSNQKISIISCLVSDEIGDNSRLIKTAGYESDPKSFPGTYVLYSAQTDASGYFNFQFPNLLPANATVDPTQGNYHLSTGELNRDASWVSWESYPETDFRVIYSPKNVKIKRVLRILIEDEAGIYMSPCENIEIDPLKSADVGTLKANVFSYKLKGGVSYNWQPPIDANSNYYYSVTQSKPINGVECYVLRDKQQISNLKLPADEGQNIVGNLDEYPDMKIISLTTSDIEGNFEFDNLIFRNVTAPVYLYFRTKDMLNDVNFSPIMHTPQVNKFGKPAYFFRNDYNYSTITGFSTTMSPRNPTLKGRVVSNINMQKGVHKASVKVTTSFTNRPDHAWSISTDTTGKFDFTAYFDWLCNEKKWIDDLSQVTVRISKTGFHYNENGVKKAVWESKFDKKSFEKGSQLVLNDIPLSSNSNIKGRLINENGEPIDGYVQFIESNIGIIDVGTGEMQRTNSGSFPYDQNKKGTFNIPALPGNNHKLAVIPKDVSYFSDTLTVNVPDGTTLNLGDIKMYERSHRIWFYVMGETIINGAIMLLPIKDATVSLVGSTIVPSVKSDQFGKVNMSFKNVSENNLTLKVSAPSNMSYVPKTISFTNQESESPIKLPNVELQKGITLKGKVLLDGQPTPDAEVYVELSRGIQTSVDIDFSDDGQKSEAESQYLFKTQTKSDGTFEIKTIPPELRNQTITVKAVYNKRASIQNFGASGHSTGTQQNNASSQLPTTQNYSQQGQQTENTSSSTTTGSIHNFSSQTQNLNTTSGLSFTSTETQNTIIGDTKEIKVPETSGNFTLNLVSFNDMVISNIWGFPFELTKLYKVPGTNGVRVSGRLKLEGYSPGFDPFEPLTLEVDNVLFVPSQQSQNGIPVGVPEHAIVNVSYQRMLKLKYGKSFNVKLTAPNNLPLTIARENNLSNFGKLDALVQIIDNSFEYPSSYLNFEGVNFYFCRSSVVQNIPTFTKVIPVFQSKEMGNGNNTVRFNLCNLPNSNSMPQNLKFKFINFNTTASISNSYIEGNEINLDATLEASVKNGGDVKIHVGRLQLKNNTLAAESGTTPITISLKDGGIYDASKAWKFEVSNWKIDPKVGGIESRNCILRTGAIDIPYSYFNLRSDFAYFGDPDVSNLSMAGYPITITPGASATTGFNPSCGGDGKGHWQLIIYPPKSGPNVGKSPAKVENLPNMNAALELETVSLLSNGENVFTIGTGAAKMKLYNVVEFRPQTVFSMSNGLILNGAVDFHIPRVKKGVGARLIFNRNKPDNINPQAEAIDIGFEGRGNVKFKIHETGQAFDRSKRTFTTYGTVEEPGKLDPIQVLLTYKSNNNINLITTEIVESPSAPNQKVKIGEDKTWLEKVSCLMNADQNDWSLLTFEGDMKGFDGIAEGSNNRMKFTVHGEIESEHSGFKADGIDNTSFDGMKITYDKGRLLGSLNMYNVPLGSVIVSGSANILMDNSGWAFYSNCTANNVPAPEPTTVNMGILIGNYPKGITPDMTNTVLNYSINKQLPPTFNDGLKGFFMVGGRNLPLSGLDLGINVVVADAYVKIPVAAVDASYYGNFAGETVIGNSLNGKISIQFGLEAITCTELFGSTTAIVGALGEYKNGSFNFSGGAHFEANLTVSQGIPYLAGCIDAVSITVPPIEGGFNFNLNPFDVKMYIGKK
jgi:TANFOR domain-containing protein